MKKLLSLALTFTLLFALAIPAQAVFQPSEQDYRALYADYKDYYNNVYVPSYYAYNQALSDLADEIKATQFSSREEAQRVIDFLKDFKTRRNAFFGNRTTEGTSRYVVPAFRNAMFAAVDEKDFASAYFLCSDLLGAVEERVGFLNGLKAEIAAFKVLPSQGGQIAASVSFNVTSYNNWWYSYTMVVTNNSSEALTDWTLLLNVNGDIDHANLSGSGYNAFGTFTANGGYTHSFSGGIFSLSPTDEWQGGYVIPAGGSVTFTGGGVSISGINGATIDGVPINISFSK